MKMHMHKPKHCSVHEMEVIQHFVGIDRETNRPVYHQQLRYPSNHPMRIYKDKKRALKQAKQSN